MTISAIVLAAGAARRFGRPKQLERWPWPDSPTLVERAVELAVQSGVSEVLVVTGNRADDVAALFAPPKVYAVPVRPVYNPRWEEGQGFSVAAGVLALPPTCQAALFMLADQPRLQVATLQTLIAAFQPNVAEILFPVHWRRGNPVLFASAFFPELAALEGDTGGRVVVMAHPEAIRNVPVDDPAIHEDVDTPEALAALPPL